MPTFSGLVALLGPWPLLQTLLLQALLPADQLASQIQAAQLQVTAHSSSSRMPLGHCIRAARQAAGLTQAQLGTRVGVCQSAVGQWEGGHTLPMLPMLRRLVAVVGPWPLLEPLLRLPAQPQQRAAAEEPRLVPPPARHQEPPPREELERFIVQQGRNDQDLAAHYQQPIGVIRRWRRGYRLDRATPPPRRMGRPPLARPSREELARLALGEGRSDQDLADRYGCSPATIKSWRRAYGLLRPQRRIDRAQVLTLLRQGLPVYQIAEAVGCTTRPIYKLAKAAGTPVATNARPRAPRRDRADPQRVLALWRQGVPVREIAETVGRKPATIYKITQAASAYLITGQRPRPGSSPTQQADSSEVTGEEVRPIRKVVGN
jgi:transcriptional regulator with XRE-family HTH domain